MNALRADGDVVLEHVALAEGRLVGHVLLSRLRTRPSNVKASALAPLAVDPGSQGEHVGGALVAEACVAAAKAGEGVVVALGDVGWYNRLGFTAAAAGRMTCEYAGPNLMARHLGPAPAEPMALRLVYPKAFAALG